MDESINHSKKLAKYIRYWLFCKKGIAGAMQSTSFRQKSIKNIVDKE